MTERRPHRASRRPSGTGTRTRTADGTARPTGGQPRRGPTRRPRSLLGDAWRDLRRNPIFWISAR